MNAITKIEPPDAMNVYAKIAAVQGELAKVGIAKGRRNQQQGYNFRGIDEVYAALSPLLSRHGLVIVPRVLSREVVERQTQKGGALFNVTVRAEFDFISADDGSIHTAATYGEAMDSADKATNKAMSAAYKYAAFMTFAIPTEGAEDADEVTHEVAPRSVIDTSDGPAPPPARAKLDGPYTSKTALQTAVKGFIHEMNGCGDGDELSAFLNTPDATALVAQVKRDAPQWWNGGQEMPAEFVPLHRQIELRETECAQATASYMTA